MPTVIPVTVKEVEAYFRASGKLVDDHHLHTICRILAHAGYREIDKMAFGPFYKGNPSMVDVVKDFYRLYGRKTLTYFPGDKSVVVQEPELHQSRSSSG
ncbi:MAG TPA: hypothetical protein VHC71_03285 [Hyphomicrobium sp.]|nr:hypothetical protein [Hyphomicrobium sp.]